MSILILQGTGKGQEEKQEASQKLHLTFTSEPSNLDLLHYQE